MLSLALSEELASVAACVGWIVRVDDPLPVLEEGVLNAEVPVPTVFVT